MDIPTQQPPKKRLTKFKLFLYVLALVGLGWLGVQAYWGFFKLQIWMAGFGTGAFWVIGLIVGFVYFYAVHRIHERIKEMPQGIKKIGAYTGFSLGLVAFNPLPWSLMLWVFFPPGDLKSFGRWFFIGCSVASAIVIGLERLFRRKKPPKQNGTPIEKTTSP